MGQSISHLEELCRTIQWMVPLQLRSLRKPVLETRITNNSGIRLLSLREISMSFFKKNKTLGLDNVLIIYLL